MALTYVNSSLTSDATAGANIAGTLAGVSAGNLLVAIISGAAGTTITGVTSSPSTTWKKAAHAANGATVDIWYALAPSSGSYTVTAAYSVSDAGCIAIHEYSNPAGRLTQVFDIGVTSSGTSLAPTATTGATDYANELVVAGLSYQSTNPTVTAGTNFTRRQTFTDAAVTGPLTTEDRFVTSTGAQTAAFASTGSIVYAEAVACFKDSAAPIVPQVIQQTAASGTTGSTTPAIVTLPAAPTVGNLMVCLIAARGAATASLAGWTQHATVLDPSAANLGLTALYRVVQAGDGTSYSFVLSSGQRWAGSLIEIADFNNATSTSWIAGTATSQNAASARTTDTTASITPGVSNCLVLSAFGLATGAVTGNAPSSPIIEYADASNTTTSTGGRLTAHQQLQGTAAPITDTVTWSGSTSVGGCDYVLAVAPLISGTSTPLSLSATQGQSATVVIQPKPILTATQSQLSSIARRAAHLLAATQAQASSISRSPAHILAATQAQSSSAALSHQTVRSLAATQTQVGSVTATHAARMTVAATQTQVGSLVRATTHILSAAQAQVGVLSRVRGNPLTATQPQVSSIIHSASHILAASQAQSTSVAFGRASTIAATATQGQLSSVVRTVAHLLSATQPQVGSLFTARIHILAATQGQSGTFARQVSHTLSAIQNQLASVRFVHPVILAATQTQTGSIVHTAAHSLSATQTQLGAISRQVGLSAHATQAQVSSVARSPAHLLLTTQAQLGSVVRQAGIRLISTQAQSASILRVISETLAATQTQVGSLSFVRGGSVLISLTSTQGQSASAAIAKAFSFTLTSTQTQVASFSRRISQDLLANQAQVASLSRYVPFSILATQGQIASLSHRTNIALSVNQTQIASLSHRAALVLSSEQGQVASLSRRATVTLVSSQTQLASVGRVLSNRLTGTQTQSASVSLHITPGGPLSATQAQSASANLAFPQPILQAIQNQACSAPVVLVGRSLNAQQDTQASILAPVSRLLVSNQAQTGSILLSVGGVIQFHMEALQAQLASVTVRSYMPPHSPGSSIVRIHRHNAGGGVHSPHTTGQIVRRNMV